MSASGASAARVADAAALATAAQDIRTLVRWAPERLLWSPGRAVWGLALVAGRGQTLISIDGCLTIAMTIWPTHYLPGVDYPYDAIARLLTANLRLKRSDGCTLFSVWLPQAVSGRCCCIGVQDDLQLVRDDVPMIPLITPEAWRAPSSLDQVEPLQAVHPSLTLIGLRPACPTAADFFAIVGEAIEATILPPVAREDQLRTWWRQHAYLERERLRLAEQEIPSWLDPQQRHDDLVAAWMAGWRGGPVPLRAPAPPTPPAVPARPPLPTPAPPAAAAAAGATEEDTENSSWMN